MLAREQVGGLDAPVKAADFFTLPPSLAGFARHFPADVPPWDWLKAIGPALEEFLFDRQLPVLPPGVHAEGSLWIHPSVKLPAYATLIGPAYIGARTQIRPGALIRGHVIIGEDCVVGNACEYKHCLLMDRVQTPHYNYVGDSILGNRAHLAAGVICSNLRLDQAEVVIRAGAARYRTGLRKCGAIVGEGAEVGCNAVLNPGTLLGPRSLVGPAIAFGGWLPPEQMALGRVTIETAPRRVPPRE